MVVNVVRQEFEKWFLENYGDMYSLALHNGEYEYYNVQVAWDAWQVSHRKTMQGYQ